jgi:large subunit ribosomal protein L13
MAENTKPSGSNPIVNLRPTKHFTSETAERKWLLVDAQGRSVGRLATTIATLLRGKHKPTFTPHDDVGDFVVVVNAEKVRFQGNDKVNKKTYFKWTGFRGNMKRRSAAQMLDLAPATVLELAVAGMIPRGALGHQLMKKLKIYAGSEHPHKAQRPETVKLPDERA